MTTYNCYPNYALDGINASELKAKWKAVRRVDILNIEKEKEVKE